MNWLRRLLGESHDLGIAREEIALARALLADARAEHEAVRGDLCRSDVRYARLTDENAVLRKRNAALEATFATLVEPGPTDKCVKVRLRDQVEAEQFARTLERNLGELVGTYEGYACPDCPRQPVSLTKFWHARATKESMRGEKGAARRKSKRRGRGLLTHVDKDVMDRLRLSAGGGNG